MGKRKIGSAYIIRCIISFTIAAMVIVSLPVWVSASIPGYIRPAREIKVFINSKEVKLSLPILNNNGRTLYPFRELLEYIGAKVDWNSEKKQAEAEYNGISLVFPLNKDIYYVNGKKIKTDTKTVLDPAAGRTYIPVRYAFEALGFDVLWIPCQKHDQVRISKLGEYNLISGEEFAGKYFNWDHTSNFYYDPDITEKRLVFKNEYSQQKFKDYILDSRLNPDINRQVYELVKTLADDDFYVYAEYCPYIECTGGGIPGRVLVKWSKNYLTTLSGSTLFEYVFSEKEPYNAREDWKCDKLSDSVAISLNIGALWWNHEDVWSTPFFEKKLRDSLISLFGAENGKDMFNYIFSEYIKNRNAERGVYFNTRKSIKFKNIQMDYLVNENAILQFYFSYVTG